MTTPTTPCELVLAEWIGWEDGRPAPRILGRLADADLVAEARARLADARRREAARLAPPVRPVAEHDPEAA